MRIDRVISIRTQSRNLLIGCICLIALLSINCGRSKDQASEEKSTITVLSGWIEEERALGVEVDGLLFLSLARPNEKGELVGQLAESWEHSFDYRTWTIHLRRDVRWHDGVPVTAHDIKFSIDLWKHPDILHWAGVRIESVTVLDDSMLTITYKNLPLAALYWIPGCGIACYPKHLLEDLDPAEYYEWEFWKHPVGNGPYRYVRHVPKTMIEFEANPDYYRGKPKIERVVLKFGPTSLTELLAGNVDAISRIRRTDALKIAGDSHFRVYYQVWDDILDMLVILWNQHHRFFRDPKVRRALTLAVNRRELPRVLNMAEHMPIIDVPYTASQYWKGELPEPLPYDPRLAKNLLEEAGWYDVDGDGIRERDGEEFSFSAMVRMKWEAAAVYIQDNFRKVGIKMEITSLDWAVLYNRMKKGDFEAVIFGVQNELFSSGDLLYFCGEDSPIGFYKPQIIERLDTIKNTMNPDEIDAVFRELRPIFQAELPWTFLTLGVETYVAHRRIKGLSTPFRANPIFHMEHLWIEDED